MKNNLPILQKDKHISTSYYSISFLGIYSLELTAETHTHICTPMFIPVLFTIAGKEQNIHQEINKIWYLYTMEYYTTLKENEVLIMLQHLWALKTNKSYTKGQILYNSTYINYNKQIPRYKGIRGYLELGREGNRELLLNRELLFGNAVEVLKINSGNVCIMS